MASPMHHLYTKQYKTWEGASKRAAFERAHMTHNGIPYRGNVNYKFCVVRCFNGVPDQMAYVSGVKYTYRVGKYLSEWPPSNWAWRV